MHIKRELLTKLRAHIDKPEMTLITGPRQAGKTTIMHQLRSELAQNGRPTVWLSLDIIEDQQHFTSQHELLKKIDLETGGKPAVVFIDEIQRLENAGRFMKGMYDMQTGHKLILSGSGSLELKEKIAESMAGRKRIFHLTTLTAAEFIHYKTNYKYEGKLEDFARIEPQQTHRLLEEYLAYGGYPGVVLAKSQKDKLATIEEIYRSYLERDIQSLLHIQKTQEFAHLVRILASEQGRIVNIARLSNMLDLSQQTVQQYIWYLEKTYMTIKVTPHHSKLQKELTKSPMYYWHDSGFANYATDRFEWPVLQTARGWIVQNWIALQLSDVLRHHATHLHYWRTTTGAEVDFVVTKGQTLYGIEVKSGPMTKPAISRSLRSFITSYRPPTVLVLNGSLRDEIHIEDTTVRFVPYAEALTSDMIENELEW